MNKFPNNHVEPGDYVWIYDDLYNTSPNIKYKVLEIKDDKIVVEVSPNCLKVCPSITGWRKVLGDETRFWVVKYWRNDTATLIDNE